MANIGLSQPYIAKYAEDTTGVVTYSDLKKIGKAVSVDLSVEGREPTILYADNGPAESYGTFGGGTANLEIDELGLEDAIEIFGLTPPASGSPVIAEFSTDAAPPYFAECFIGKKVHNAAVKWRLIVLYRVQFMVPNYTINTQGQSVEFQVPSLGATVLARPDGKWQAWADYDTEADAIAAMRTVLGI